MAEKIVFINLKNKTQKIQNFNDVNELNAITKYTLYSEKDNWDIFYFQSNPEKIYAFGDKYNSHEFIFNPDNTISECSPNKLDASSPIMKIGVKTNDIMDKVSGTAVTRNGVLFRTYNNYALHVFSAKPQFISEFLDYDFQKDFANKQNDIENENFFDKIYSKKNRYEFFNRIKNKFTKTK